MVEDQVKQLKVRKQEKVMRLRGIFEYSDTIKPFNNEDKDIDWIRLSMSELMSIKQFSYEWCTQAFITLSYNKFGFLLLGRHKEFEEYYIGIPDIYDPKQRYILSLDKIEKFRFRDENNVKKIGAYGYWIARVQ